MERTSGASWMGLAQKSSPPLPSWLAPPPDVSPAVTRWTARPSQGPERWTSPPLEAEISYLPAPIIEMPDEDRARAYSMPPSAPDTREDSPELSELLAELRSTVLSVKRGGEELRRETLEASERDLVRLAIAIATRVVGRELEADPTLIATWAREGIEAIGSQDRVVVALSPEIVEALETRGEREGLSTVADIVSDPRMTKSECEVRGRFGRVDEGVLARLDAVVAALELDDDEELLP